MRFWDSSAVVPLLVAEEATGRMQAEFRDDPAMIVWWATEIDCVSALSRLERDGDLMEASAAKSLERLDALRSAWHEVEPVARVRQTARRLLRTHPLRAADSLQLAAALVVAENRPDSLPLLTLDGRLAAAAAREGMQVPPLDE